MEPSRRELALIGRRISQLPQPEGMRDHIQKGIDELTALRDEIAPPKKKKRQQSEQGTFDRMDRSGTDRSEEESED